MSDVILPDATRKKLREAEFFFLQLRHADRQILSNFPEAPDYYLSAFLSAGRSVGHAARAEAAKVYVDWWARRAEGMGADERELLKLTKEQRDEGVHARGVDVEIVQTELTPIDWLQQLAQQGAFVHLVQGVPGEMLPPVGQAGAPERRFAGSDERVVEVCDRYLALLQRILREFEAFIGARQ